MDYKITPHELSRFESKYIIGPTGCHLWQDPLDKDGYGSFFFRRKTRRAHRVALFLAGKELTPGMVVDHSCPNRHCVNPQHLKEVTKRENALENSRSIAAVNAQKTICPKGHPFDKTYKSSRTGRDVRYCSICEKEKTKRLRKKWAEEDPLKNVL